MRSTILSLLILLSAFTEAVALSLPTSGYYHRSLRILGGAGSNVGGAPIARRRPGFCPSALQSSSDVRCTSSFMQISPSGLRLGYRGGMAPRKAMVSATDAEFKEIVLQGDSNDVIIVVFWAPWCGPCRMLKPVLDELEAEYGGKIKLVQMNTDENQAAATEFGVRSIPTTMLFKGGERLDMAIGAVPKSTLEAMVLKRI